MTEIRNVHKSLVGKLERKRPLGKLKRRWLDNIRMDLGETRWEVWAGCIWLRTETNGGLLWSW
jgi:hypothetical protein